MNDYLSTLAARSLRREPACEPRRAQMFEPRTEKTEVETVEGAAVETSSTASTTVVDAQEIEEHHAGALSAPRAESVEQGHNAHVSPHQTTHTRQSEDAPDVSEHSLHNERRVEPVLEATDRHVARRTQMEAAAEKPVAQPTRGVTATRRTSHVIGQHAEEFVDSPPPVSSRRSTYNPERAATLDEEGREETAAVARRVPFAPRDGQLESKNVESRFNVESVLRSRPSNSAQASEAPARPDSEPITGGVSSQLKPSTTSEVRPLPTQPTAREASTQAPPTIEVSIGRIEVRAVTPPAPPPSPRQKNAPPKMSLDDYLRAQSGGRS